MTTRKGGEIAAEALLKHGVDVIFTLCCGHLNPIYVNLEGKEIRFFDTLKGQNIIFLANPEQIRLHNLFSSKISPALD